MRPITVLVIAASCITSSAQAQQSLVEAIKNADAGGKTAKAVRTAFADLSKRDVKVLPMILNGFDSANPIAANWLRGAFEAVADGHMKAGGKLPAEQLLVFIKDTSKDKRARRLAYDWLVMGDKSLSEKLIPGMLKDPSPEFRRDAVQSLIGQAAKAVKAGDEKAGQKLFQLALTGVVHADQATEITEALDKLGQKVDLQKHFGFVPAWSVVGPFDNKEGVGFAKVYGPEKDATKTEFEGQSGKVKWQSVSTEDTYGLINIAKEIENFKGSCMYATATFESGSDQNLEIRLSTPNAWKLWVNGKMAFGREEYHRAPRNIKMDHYTVPVKLMKGKNRILLKLCQNEQEQDWAQRYEFQIRVCDSTGTGIQPAATNASLPRNAAR